MTTLPPHIPPAGFGSVNDQPHPQGGGPLNLNNPSAWSDANMRSVVRRLNTFGLHSFLILAESKPREYACLFEKITMNESVKLLMNGIAQSFEYDVRAHPDRSESYKQAVKAFLTDLNQAVFKLNEKTSML